MRFLVTGAAGFIGSSLVDDLLADGHAVAGIDDLSTGSMDNLAAAQAGPHSANFQFHQHDITDPAVRDLVVEARPEVVVHLAAQMDVRVSVRDPRYDATVNILGLIEVAEGAVRARTRKLILASSGGTIYGSPDVVPVQESQDLRPESPYAASKVAGEYYLRAYQAMYGLDFSVLALGNVFGPRQTPHGEAGVVAIFGSALLEGRPTTIFGDGTSCRDYVYIDDTVSALAHFAQDVGDGERINIGTGIAMPVREVHRTVAAAAGAPDEPQFAPARTGEVHKIAVDPTRANDLGWQPKVSFEDGVGRTVDWLRSVT